MDEAIADLYYYLLVEEYEVFMLTEISDGFDITLRKTHCKSDEIPSINEFITLKLLYKKDE